MFQQPNQPLLSVGSATVPNELSHIYEVTEHGHDSAGPSLMVFVELDRARLGQWVGPSAFAVSGSRKAGMAAVFDSPGYDRLLCPVSTNVDQCVRRLGASEPRERKGVIRCSTDASGRTKMGVRPHYGRRQAGQV